jgi:hypothetical protein
VLPFLIVDNERHLKTITTQLLSCFSDFKEERNSNTEIAGIDDPALKRHASERFFSEWAFRVAHEKCM